jgi:7-cyano-7-deazaguanine synthase
MKRALLLSGGMDSSSIAYWRRPDLAITIDYGQRSAAGELRASTAIASALGVRQEIVRCDLSALGSGDLAGTAALASAPASEWWPYRNQMLVTLAAMVCAKHGIECLEVGALRTDGFHADGRPDFIESLSALLRLQEGGMTLEAPAIHLSAEELVKVSAIPLELLAWTHSCHVSDYACGTCRGCEKHYRTTEALGYDPW